MNFDEVTSPSVISVCVAPPERLSVAIRMGVWDQLWVESQPETYTVVMEVWHEGAISDRTCQVCFFGGVLAGTLKVDPRTVVETDNIPDDWKRVAYALDSVRKGDTEEAIEDFYHDKHPRRRSQRLPEIEAIDWDYAPNVRPYDEWADGFRRSALELADWLERFSL